MQVLGFYELGKKYMWMVAPIKVNKFYEYIHVRDFNKKNLSMGLKWWVGRVTANKLFLMDGLR